MSRMSASMKGRGHSRSRSLASSGRPISCSGRGSSCRRAGGVGGDVSPLAHPVQRDEGRRCQASQGAGGRERSVEACRGRSTLENSALEMRCDRCSRSRHPPVVQRPRLAALPERGLPPADLLIPLGTALPSFRRSRLVDHPRQGYADDPNLPTSMIPTAIMPGVVFLSRARPGYTRTRLKRGRRAVHADHDPVYRVPDGAVASGQRSSADTHMSGRRSRSDLANELKGMLQMPAGQPPARTSLDD
jgi:hypothetical protein